MLERILRRIHKWVQRHEKPLELDGPICPGCGHAVADPARALKFGEDLFHADCWVAIPTVMRRKGAV